MCMYICILLYTLRALRGRQGWREEGRERERERKGKEREREGEKRKKRKGKGREREERKHACCFAEKR